MGLFSFLSKNKQDRTAQDSGRFTTRAEDDAIAQRARAKRASHAGEGARRGRDPKGADDPVLPEKKRARRRLVGAIALALAAAVGLPMLLDSAPPKPLPGDIAIEIPSKDKAAPMPMPSEPPAVAAADSVDKGEEIVEPPKAAQQLKDPQAVAEVRTAAPAKTEVTKAEAKPEAPKPAPPKAEPAKPEHRSAAKPAEAKPAEKPAPRKADEKPSRSQPPADTERALAILEGKQADKAREAGDKVTIQVAALGSAEKAAELQAKLRAAGIHSFTEKVSRPGGDLIRVKVGPFSKDEADKMHARLAKIK